eukprot:m51a1_g14252 hypothetical protein (327) ;mRNA; f:266776-268494
MSRIPAALQEKWVFIGQKRYADQAKWMLNGFWDQLENEAENVWTWVQGFAHFDEEKRAEGHDLDEFWSHKFLESLGQTMTVIEMREKFRAIDADFNKRMSLIEYMMHRYKFPVEAVINAPQGENKEEIAKAQAMVDAAQRAVDDLTVKLEASRTATEKAKAAAAEAKKTAEAAWFADQENKKALEELHRQEKAYEDKKSELQRLKDDSTIGIVRRNKAANELDQLLSEDPLPLRKAKITQAATVKKSEKASQLASEAKARADADAEAADAAERAVEEAVREAERKFQEALDYLEKAKKLGGVANGDIWWMQREIAEKKKYLPAKRQ